MAPSTPEWIGWIYVFWPRSIFPSKNIIIHFQWVFLGLTLCIDVAIAVAVPIFALIFFVKLNANHFSPTFDYAYNINDKGASIAIDAL